MKSIILQNMKDSRILRYILLVHRSVILDTAGL